MALSKSSSKSITKVFCLKIEYKYTDLELHEDVTNVDYVDDVDDLPEYFNNILTDNHILDVHCHPHSRYCPSFKITTVSLSEKEYNKLFHV